MALALVARGPSDRHSELRAWIERAGDECRFFQSAEELSDSASRATNRIRGIFFDAAVLDSPAFVASLRKVPSLVDLPVVALVDGITHRAFTDALHLGADDVVAIYDRFGIIRRATILSAYEPGSWAPPRQGRVAVVHPNEIRRRALGRTMRFGGFDVLFASEMAEVGARGTEAAIVLAIIAEPEGDDETGARLTELRSRIGNPELPIVLLARDEEDHPGQGFTALPRVAYVKDEAPVDRLLFVANELLRPEVRDVRSSARLLLNTLCAFRPAGEFASTYGLTYNASFDGLFVRTLDPQSRETPVWLELRPRDDAPVVHLRARVVWVRDMKAALPAPPGFGARIIEEESPRADLTLYRKIYDEVRRAG